MPSCRLTNSIIIMYGAEVKVVAPMESILLQWASAGMHHMPTCTSPPSYLGLVRWGISTTVRKFATNLPVTFRLVVQCLKHRRCCLLAASSVHYTTSCKHSLVLLRMGEIIARNMSSWLKLLIINYYCCTSLAFSIIVSMMHCHTNIKQLPTGSIVGVYTTGCKHSLVLLRMGEIIARNMSRWLKLLIINFYCCI